LASNTFEKFQGGSFTWDWRTPVKVVLDIDRCSGHGRCYSLSPDVFASDEEGHSLLKVEGAPPELEEQVRQAAANCPERAISVEE
jgi:ferredoxin